MERPCGRTHAGEVFYSEFCKDTGRGVTENVYGMNRILLYINTVKYLRPVQIQHQILNRLRRRRKEKLLGQVMKLHASQIGRLKILIPILDYDKAYVSRFQVKDLLENQIEILHEKHTINLTRWEVAEASHLWNYNLHYLEFLIPLAAACREDESGQCFHKWCEYVDSWMEYPAQDSFEPYTISMRIPNLLICMDILQEKLEGSELEKKLTDSIYRQYRYLLATQELALLANHYFENLKTIVICSVLFGEKENYRKYFRRFCGQIKEQILSDGVHYERSFLYHKIILEDILRVYTVLQGRTQATRLLPVIESMAAALASVSRGFQRMPLFNDAGDHVAKDTDSLLRAVEDITGHRISDDRTAFEEAGYYKLYAGDSAALFDCGQIGPSYMGGHAHCDCLSFELVRGGKPLFVNSGTYQYQGKLRAFFRSTMAHNTVMIDEREQAQLWGEHRAARRMSEIECRTGQQSVSGKYKSFQGDCFHRKIRLTGKDMEITDHIVANDHKAHCARQFLHIAAEYYYASDDGQHVLVRNDDTNLAVISVPAGSSYVIHREGELCCLAQDFGRLQKKEALEIRTPFVKQTGIRIMIDLL